MRNAKVLRRRNGVTSLLDVASTRVRVHEDIRSNAAKQVINRKVYPAPHLGEYVVFPNHPEYGYGRVIRMWVQGRRSRRTPRYIVVLRNAHNVRKVVECQRDKVELARFFMDSEDIHRIHCELIESAPRSFFYKNPQHRFHMPR